MIYPSSSGAAQHALAAVLREGNKAICPDGRLSPGPHLLHCLAVRSRSTVPARPGQSRAE